MNERINQLADQARHWAHFDGLAQNPKSSPSILFEQKFAELIVKECAFICLRQSRSGWNDDRKAQARLDCDLIKEHFGVE